jgi:hypothetical protein
VRGSLREVAGGDHVGGVGHRLQGPQVVLDDQPGSDPEADQHERERNDLDAEQAAHGLRRLRERHGHDEDALDRRHRLHEDAEPGAAAAGGTRVEQSAIGVLCRSAGQRRRKLRSRLGLGAVGVGDLVEDGSLSVSQLAVGARRQTGPARAPGLVRQSRYLAARQGESHGPPRLAQLLIDPLQQERAQRGVRCEAGDQQACRDEAEQGEEQPRAQAHGQSRGVRMV